MELIILSVSFVVTKLKHLKIVNMEKTIKLPFHGLNIGKIILEQNSLGWSLINLTIIDSVVYFYMLKR